MDGQATRAENRIVDAFICVRAKKPLEKITVKEITALARVNKTTFYRHFQDIYALSDAVEDELIGECLACFPNAEALLAENGLLRLADAFMTQSRLFGVVFSGSRMPVAIQKIHDALMERICQSKPEFLNDLSKRVRLTAMIYGIFCACLIYKDGDAPAVLSALSELNDSIRL